MNVKAIDNVSVLSFAGKAENKKNINRKPENTNDYPQQNSPASKNAAKSMRNLIYGLILLGAAAGANTSCVKIDEGDPYAYAKAWAYSIGDGCDCNGKNDTTVIRDTIRDTVIVPEIKPIYVKEYPFHLADSLIRQGLNIGVPLEGPVPQDENNDVAFVASKAYNRYDAKYYETQVDTAGTNKDRLALVTKVLDFYEDPENPKTSWLRAEVVDVPGKGIRLDRYVSNSSVKPEIWNWNYAGYEIRTNNRNGQTNTKSIFDNSNNLIWQGEYKRGVDDGTFMYGTIVYDENGNPYYDENGEPQVAYYDFDQAKMWSERVEKEQINEGVTYKSFDK